jgi:argonaute-like protein implicated in RNA metabolism and viral defense
MFTDGFQLNINTHQGKQKQNEYFFSFSRFAKVFFSRKTVVSIVIGQLLSINVFCCCRRSYSLSNSNVDLDSMMNDAVSNLTSDGRAIATDDVRRSCCALYETRDKFERHNERTTTNLDDRRLYEGERRRR